MSISPSSFIKLTRHMGYFPHRTNVGLVESEDGLYIIDTGDCELDGKDIIESCMVLFPEKKSRQYSTHIHILTTQAETFTSRIIPMPRLGQVQRKLPYSRIRIL